MTRLPIVLPRVLPKVVIYTRSGRAWTKVSNGWLDLGDADAVLRLDPLSQLALLRDRIASGAPCWHEIPRRPM
jgi:hypothetical protein